MKKTLSLLTLLLSLTIGGANARLSDFAKYYNVILQYRQPTRDKARLPRIPSKPINAIMEGDVLKFETCLSDANVEIILDEMVVFSSTIDENGVVTLPENLNGEYELRLYVDDNVYTGIIEL